ncbi:MAG: low molecular weight phosphotyrosine protein phosphatase [Burkholderiaceae bacterium]|nr:MAG: low molecular weight phosphotyrosine protein phosphatase [Burkholderiaceae bacterium]
MQGNRIYKILFVCMGNICRSPSAEGVFRQQLERAGLSQQFLVDSAGTHAYHIGEPPDLRSQEHALKRGIDLSQQRARQVSVEDFEHFDLVLAMDQDNLALLQRKCPAHLQHKLKLMMSYASHSPSDVVPDPYYGGTQGFETVLDYLEDASAGLLRSLRA